MSRRHTFQHIRDRDWEAIRNSWLESMPAGRLPGQPPDPDLSILPGIPEFARGGQTGAISADVPGLRAGAIAEGVFLVHKGLHVLRAAQAHAMAGMLSWSLFSAYHSAFLSAKGTLALLGVLIVRPEGNQALLDLFPQSEARHTRRRRINVERVSTFMLVKTPQLEQRSFWELFQRVVREANAAVWRPEIRESILAVGWDEISPPRNRFIYNSGYWPLPDLFDAAGVGLLADGLRRQELDVEDVSFLMGLACRIATLAESLLFSLADVAESIAQEVLHGRYKNQDWPTHNPLYHSFEVAAGFPRLMGP